MTVKELKEIIKDLPDHMEVYVSERKTEFAYGYVNSAYTKEINFMEEPDSNPLSKDTVLILDEE